MPNVSREYLQTTSDDPDYFVIYKTYVDPAIYVIIIILGLTFNGTLLIMFLRHKEIRTTGNIMILNLTVCDLLNICINAPLHYSFHYYKNELNNVLLCRIITAVRQFFRCVSASSLLALSVQRYCATNPRVQYFNSRCRVASFVLVVWVFPLGVAVPPSVTWDFYRRMCSYYNKNNTTTRLVIILTAVLYCVVFPALVLGFNLLTARRLRHSAHAFPGETGHSIKSRRKRSAGVVTSLAVLYVISYVPYWVWCSFVYNYDVDRHSGVVLFTEYVFKYLLFADACFNPLTLYFTSITFKNMFRRYMCCS
ncbi:hypothetical protein L9F63_025366 [Diploptera punctata]|uniref:G-protein coupled receptors family 1 profile domain-containing protein n=1 Tax=Diploptera punctata TaxID=6984 RepID=A0AAD7ZA52_DIPPU|nr:hypothetical protein L9F63_025366 [Diploptera punctata]